ncbi:hypothetical protein [Rhodovibrio sodomensis]|nr:hypothetical protein [Rhodovibrio sodomensis]
MTSAFVWVGFVWIGRDRARMPVSASAAGRSADVTAHAPTLSGAQV